MELCREPRVGDGPSDERTVVSGTGQWCWEGHLDRGSDLGDLPQGRGRETLPDLFLLHAALEILCNVCTGRQLKRWVGQEGLARFFTPLCCSYLNLL